MLKGNSRQLKIIKMNDYPRNFKFRVKIFCGKKTADNRYLHRGE